MTVGELVTWAELQGWGLRKWTARADWLGSVVVLPYAVDVAYTWASWRPRQAPGKASTRERHVGGGVLHRGGHASAPRNVKDFADFVEHHGLRLALD